MVNAWMDDFLLETDIASSVAAPKKLIPSLSTLPLPSFSMTPTHNLPLPPIDVSEARENKLPIAVLLHSFSPPRFPVPLLLYILPWIDDPE